MDDADDRRRWRAGSASPPIRCAASRVAPTLESFDAATSQRLDEACRALGPDPRDSGRRVVRRPHRAALRGPASGAGPRAGRSPRRRGRGSRCRRRAGALAGAPRRSLPAFALAAPGRIAARASQRLFRSGAIGCASAGGCCGTWPGADVGAARGDAGPLVLADDVATVAPRSDRADADRHRRRRPRPARPAGEHAAVSSIHRRAPRRPARTAPDTWAR